MCAVCTEHHRTCIAKTHFAIQLNDDTLPATATTSSLTTILYNVFTVLRLTNTHRLDLIARSTCSTSKRLFVTILWLCMNFYFDYKNSVSAAFVGFLQSILQLWMTLFCIKLYGSRFKLVKYSQNKEYHIIPASLFWVWQFQWLHYIAWKSN